MIISEFLPNPIGKDTDGEWLKIFNDGSSVIDLKGWSVKDASGKIFKFTKETPVSVGGYFKLDYSASKISINNSGETIFLYEPAGALADKAEYSGSAPEGKTLIRQNGKFVFSGEEKNNGAVEEKIINEPVQLENYSASTILNPVGAVNSPVLFSWISTSLILSSVFIIVWRRLNVPDKFN